jgi:hypothetical protein
LALAAFALAAGPAAARTDNLPPPPPGPPATGPQPSLPPPPKKARIIFPVVGPVNYRDDFGEPRGGGPHQGNDIMASKRSLAVAAEAGKVKLWTTSARAGCMLYLYGRSGTTYLYVHLNNDVTKGNDNRGRCVAGTAYAKGLKSGAQVAAGEPVGYVGDSGDANGVASHLHFEVHPKGGAAVSPFAYLKRARRLLFAAKPKTVVSLKLGGTIVAAPPDQLTMKVSTLAASTGLKIKNVGRTIVVSLPLDVDISAVGSLVATARLTKGKSVAVSTEEAPVTLAAELGSPGALAAATVSVG